MKSFINYDAKFYNNSFFIKKFLLIIGFLIFRNILKYNFMNRKIFIKKFYLEINQKNKKNK